MPRLDSDGWTWRVHYSDGTTFDEYDVDGDGATDHGFQEVDLTRVAVVEWIPLHEGLTGHVVKIDVSAGMRPILFRRRSRIINLEEETETAGPVIHCLGWQKTVEGVNVASYTSIFEDGSTLTTDDFQAV